MSIQKECEVLQSVLSKAINLLVEARTNTTRLSSCSISEIKVEISGILDICQEGMSSLEKSLEQVELLQAMLGNIGQSSSEKSAVGDKPQQKDSPDKQAEQKTDTYLDDSRLSVGEKYDWKLDDQDAHNFKDFRHNSTTQDKRNVSQSYGEIYGDKLTTEVLKYETILDPVMKYDSFSQGFDAVYYDKETDAVVIAEFKGQRSSASEAQKKFTWVPNVLRNIAEGNGVYTKASTEEWDLAKLIIEKYEKGDNIRYELFRTKFNEKTRQFYTVLEERKYLSKNSNISQKKQRGKI